MKKPVLTAELRPDLDPAIRLGLKAAVERGPKKGEFVLSVRQPYAWSIVHGLKPIENRTWTTSHRGLLWIHASRSKPDMDLDDWVSIVVPDGRRPKDYGPLGEPSGAIIGACWLSACWKEEDAPLWAHDSCSIEGPVYWFLSAALPMKEPVAKQGKVGLFKV